MKKDTKWLKGEIKNFQEGENMFTDEFNAGVQDALEYVQDLIDQLDEPEVLSLDWIDDNKKDSGVHSIGYYVPIGKLHDLLVPKQDEPETLSQEWIDENKVARINDLRKMTTSDVVPVEKLKNLLVSKQDNGFDAEKEKLYQVELPTERLHHILTMHGDGKGHFFGKEHTNNFWYRTYLTEQEIKAIDERFWAFAQEVTQ